MANIRIGVVTVTYNSAHVLPEFLECVFRQTFRDFVLYVIDNASKDNSIAIVASFADSRIRIIANKGNLGVAEGNNQGIRAALLDGCDAVLLLNNDTSFQEGLFQLLYDGLGQHDCSMTVPKIYYHDSPDRIWAAGGYFRPWLTHRIRHYGAGTRDDGQFDTIRSVTYAPTCCVLIHRDVFSSLGLMDPLYFVYVDDVDFMYRALRAGFSLKYLPQCKLWHKVGSLTGGGASNFTVRYLTRNRTYYLYKNFPTGYAKFWNTLYWLYEYFRYRRGRDSREVWHLKRDAMREGLRLYRSVALSG